MSNSDVQVDFLIIGAGVVGCALASHLSQKFKNKSILVVEAGPRIAEGVTSRNSGVIHAGIYYPPASLKAQSCIRGKNLLYEWVKNHQVGYKKTGKIIISRSSEESEQLHKLYANAIESGATGLKKISSIELQKLEPDLGSFDEALLSEETGIVDPYELTRSFQVKAGENGVQFALNTTVKEIILNKNAEQKIKTTLGDVSAQVVFNCAGLFADEICNLAGILKYKIYPSRGDYFTLSTNLKFNHLIYPVKNPKDTGLGVHLTIDLSGRYRLGPDAEYVESKTDFSSRENKLDKFTRAAQKLFGPMAQLKLSYDTSGIRPKLRAPNETDEKDFIVSKDHPGMINLVGIESPGLTAAMALAEKACELI